MFASEKHHCLEISLIEHISDNGMQRHIQLTLSMIAINKQKLLIPFNCHLKLIRHQ